MIWIIKDAADEKEIYAAKLRDKVFLFMISQSECRYWIEVFTESSNFSWSYLVFELFKGEYFKYAQLMIEHGNYSYAATFYYRGIHYRELSLEQKQILYEDDIFVRALLRRCFVRASLVRVSSYEQEDLQFRLKEAKLLCEDPRNYDEASLRLTCLKRLKYLTPEDESFFSQKEDFMQYYQKFKR